MGITFRSVLAGGGSGNGVSLVVSCDSAFAGKTITCTDGTTTLTETCPSTSPYTVEFKGIPAGTWTVSGTVDGETVSESITVSDYAVTLNILSNIYKTNYDTAYGVINELVSKGTAAHCGNLAHMDGTGALYNTYYSTSSDIANISTSTMTSNYSDGTHNIVTNKMTFTNTGDKTTANCLVDGFVVVSRTYVEPASLNMSTMISRGNVFDFIIVKAGDKINLPYETPDNENTIVTFYEKL